MKIIITFIVLVIVLSTLSFKMGIKSCNKLKKKMIEVRKSNIHNKGVFANYNIKKGDLVEIAPFLKLKDKSAVNDYVYLYTISNIYCFVLGNGSIYNHSNNYNLDFYVDEENSNFEYYANKDIRQGEELFINYGIEYWKTRGVDPK